MNHYRETQCIQVYIYRLLALFLHGSSWRDHGWVRKVKRAKNHTHVHAGCTESWCQKIPHLGRVRQQSWMLITVPMTFLKFFQKVSAKARKHFSFMQKVISVLAVDVPENKLQTHTPKNLKVQGGESLNNKKSQQQAFSWSQQAVPSACELACRSGAVTQH